MSLQVIGQALVERLEQENFNLMREINRKDRAINALISDLSLAIEIMREG